MSIQQARIAGGKAFREQWGSSLLALLLGAAGMIVATVFVFGLGGLIAAGPINVGLYHVYYRATQGEKMEYQELLYGFKTNFGEIVLGYLIKYAVIAAIVAASYVLIAAMALAFSFVPIVSVIFIILIVMAAVAALIIVSLFLAAAEYILMREPEAKGLEAVKKSKKIMTGNTGRYFGFVLSFIGWFILTNLFFPLAVYTLPYFFMAKTYFLGSIYDEAERREQAAPADGKAPQAAAPVGGEAPQAAALAGGETPQAAAPVKFCKHCGSPLPKEAVFCSSCGKSQAAETGQVNAEPLPAAEKTQAEESAETVKEKAAEAPMGETAEGAAEKTEDIPVGQDGNKAEK